MQEDAPQYSSAATPETISDGVGRLRLPGGRVSPGRWTQIAELAELGDGRIQLSGRGNLQIHGVDDAAQFSVAATAAGFRPGYSLIASPLARLHDLVTEIDHAVSSQWAGSGLLLGIDDGSGDILGQQPDLGLQLDAAHERARLIRRGRTGDALLPLPEAVRELCELCSTLEPDISASGRPAENPTNPELPIGWLPAADQSVTLGAGLREGLLDSHVARMIDVIEVETTVTPWAGLLIHDLSEPVADQVLRVLAPLGLIFDKNSPWI